MPFDPLRQSPPKLFVHASFCSFTHFVPQPGIRNQLHHLCRSSIDIPKRDDESVKPVPDLMRNPSRVGNNHWFPLVQSLRHLDLESFPLGKLQGKERSGEGGIEELVARREADGDHVAVEGPELVAAQFFRDSMVHPHCVGVVDRSFWLNQVIRMLAGDPNID